MSKNWYPVINYEKCTECGTCTNKCKKGVYDLEKLPTPVVVNPDGCVDGCHGCGNLCLVQAISYIGEEKIQNNVDCCCSGDNDE